MILSYIYNMNLKPILAAGALGFILWRLLGKKQLAANAKFTFDKLDFNLKQKKVVISLGVLNPTNNSVVLSSIVGTLLVSGQDVATLENYTPVKIAPNQKTRLNLTLTPTATGIFTVLKDFVRQKLKGITKTPAKFTGTANFNGITFPVNTILN